MTRRTVLGAFAGIASLAAAPVYAKAPGLIREAGDIRKIRMYSQRTGEKIDTIYWVDGEYIPEVLNEISFFMRDWRQNELISYDPRNVDVMAAAQHKLDTSEPYLMISGYRSRKTNDMLRARSRGVASNSYHIKGMAADLRLRSRSVAQMYNAAYSCNAGGVGKYTHSNFVHMDCGPVRTWGR
ncbi:DUF882 domain-containing protein [Paroceanicella profunda]|uniref:Murein endopeptidase K n=1 Tax=Paroceanicella profunda TaxID=2579971 RepID=A0A5B8G2S2_9RHOB|nr:DUF882 domain-containing protein [Paroceanicella profunda]QDL92923.1 DUF882 domain-containing protein [Paroceanicella profunda]